jgi:hypothetical protein
MKEISLGILLLISSLASASVWDELQSGNTQSFQARIISLTPENGDFLVNYSTDDGRKSNGKLCKSPSTATSVDAWEVAAANLQVQALQDAVKSSRLVQLSIRGPWSPCLNVVLAPRNPTNG